LLTEQVAALESENANLKEKIKNLEQKLANLAPQPGGLDKVSLDFLKLLFEHDELSIEAIAASLKISKGIAQYHCDLLSEAGLIQQTRFGYESEFGSSPATYGILLKGRQYVVKNSEH
jgi:response regulator of citrate/malate metabolism